MKKKKKVLFLLLIGVLLFILACTSPKIFEPSISDGINDEIKLTFVDYYYYSKNSSWYSYDYITINFYAEFESFSNQKPTIILSFPNGNNQEISQNYITTSNAFFGFIAKSSSPYFSAGTYKLIFELNERTTVTNVVLYNNNDTTTGNTYGLYHDFPCLTITTNNTNIMFSKVTNGDMERYLYVYDSATNLLNSYSLDDNMTNILFSGLYKQSSGNFLVCIKAYEFHGEHMNHLSYGNILPITK